MEIESDNVLVITHPKLTRGHTDALEGYFTQDQLSEKPHQQ